MKKGLFSKKGFTLAEILVVIAIVSVLMAISIPILFHKMENIRRSVDIANARSMKSILVHSYMDGTIEFTSDKYGGNKTCMAVLVEEDGTTYRASGSVLVNGQDWNADKGYGDYARVKKLFENAGLSETKVLAKNTNDDGWKCYCVVLYSDGQCRIFSSPSNLDLGGTSGGVFEQKMAEILTDEKSGIEKALGA